MADAFRTAATGWQARLLPIAQRTFMLLAALEFCVSGLVWAVKRESLDDLAAKFLLKFTLIAFLLTLLTAFNTWVPPIFDGFVAAGQQVAGRGVLTPNGILGLGAQIAWTLALQMIRSAFSAVPLLTPFCVFAVVVVFASYLVVALQLLLVMVDSYVTIIGGGVLFLAFAASRWTAAYAEHLIAHVFRLGARAFLLYLITAVGIDVTTNAIQPYVAATNLLGAGAALFRFVGTVVAFAYIAVRVPKDLSSALMSHTSLGLSTALQRLS
jgi:P-type conjugative transfer protein TrbL